jgi:16S rRNA (uracil1498-N3)-methyltransferase
MKQFILREMPDKRGRIQLSGDDYHYLVRVRRLKPGDAFTVLLPNGGQAKALVSSIDGGVLAAHITDAENMTHADTSALDKADCMRAQPHNTPETAQHDRTDNLPPIVLFQALPKGSKMDLIVRQAAEGGISEIIPFVSEFSVHAAQSSDTGKGRLERWRRIIREALQQSGSATATIISEPKSCKEMLAYWKGLCADVTAVGFILHEKQINTHEGDGQADPEQPGQGLEQGSFHRYLYGKCALAALAVGPEGGFSANEVKNFLEAGFHPVTIGKTVLRTETAALYGAAAIRILLLEKAAWTAKQ